MFIEITAKLGNMRKAVKWTVYPHVTGHESNEVMIQSDRRIAKFNTETGEGFVSDGKGGHPGFYKLLPMAGARPVTVPQEVIDAALAAQPKSGDTIGGVLTIA